MVSDVRKAAEAVYEVGVNGKAERYVPRPYGMVGALKIIAPAVVRKALGGGAAQMMTTRTGADAAEETDRQASG